MNYLRNMHLEDRIVVGVLHSGGGISFTGFESGGEEAGFEPKFIVPNFPRRVKGTLQG